MPSWVSRSYQPLPALDRLAQARRARPRRASPTAPGRSRIRSRPLVCSSSASQCSRRRFDDLGQHAAGRPRVQEGDPAVADPGPRLGVDQLDAVVAELRQRRLDVVDPVGDVVQARALALEELADRASRGRAGAAARRGSRRRRAAPPRRPARRPSRGARRASRRCPRRAPARRRGRRRRRRRGRSARTSGAEVSRRGLGGGSLASASAGSPGARLDVEQRVGCSLRSRFAAMIARISSRSITSLAQQPLGDLVEQVAVVGEQLVRRRGRPPRRSPGPPRRGSGAGTRRPSKSSAGTWCERIVVPIPYSWTIERAIAVTRLEVVGGAGGHPAEGDLLGDAPGEQHLHVVDQLLARLQVAVLLRQVERVAERLAAGDDRDLLHLVDARQQLGDERVAGLVPGDDPLLVSR